MGLGSIGNIARKLATTANQGRRQVAKVIRNRHGSAPVKRMLKRKQRSRANRLRAGTYKRNSEKDAYTK